MAKFDTIPDWRGLHVAVLGYGVEGRSSVNYFLNHGAKVSVHDDAVLDSLDHAWIEHLERGVEFWVGGQGFGDLNQYDWIVRSPGINPERAELESVDKRRITSQTEIFLTRWRDHSVGITGSKGKGTTTTLLAHFLRQSGRDVLVGGNIGQPLLDLMGEMDEQITAVLELSSFQLQDIKVSPAIAIVLMVIPEHLNYHGRVESYVEAKSQILAWQRAGDVAIINYDFELSRQIAGRAKGEIWRFGADPACDVQLRDKAVFVQGAEKTERLAGMDDLPMRGVHNLQNVAAAGLAGMKLGLSVGQMRSALHSYQPLPHRLSLVAQTEKLSFYDDSFATTPEAAVAALSSFDEPLAMIVGGADKGSDFTPLVSALRGYTQLMGLEIIGALSTPLAEMCRDAGLHVPMVVGQSDMNDMVATAAEFLGERCGVVLLSPGAASFGLFKDYKERGDKFAAAAKALTENHR